MYRTKPVTFSCQGNQLVGLLDVADSADTKGILIVVGGPQYRVGSHRQFVRLARETAAAGFATMRFDHRGIGDSDGDAIPFDDLDADIRAAIDTLCAELPRIQEIVIWGLCDAASAALIYAYKDPRVRGLVLLNPWVRSEQSLARAYVGQYYVAKAFSADFWRRVLTGKVDLGKVLGSFLANAVSAWGPSRRVEGDGSAESTPFQERMLEGLRRFGGRILFVLSGNDLTAREFEDLVQSDRRWSKALKRDSVAIERIPDANHTFSRRQWRNKVTDWTLKWLRSW